MHILSSHLASHFTPAHICTAPILYLLMACHVPDNDNDAINGKPDCPTVQGVYHDSVETMDSASILGTLHERGLSKLVMMALDSAFPVDIVSSQHSYLVFFAFHSNLQRKLVRLFVLYSIPQYLIP